MKANKLLKSFICVVIILTFITGMIPVGMASSDTTPQSIDLCIEDGKWSISGVTYPTTDTSVLISDENSQVKFLDQQKSGLDGSYSFTAALPTSNTYSVKVGGAGLKPISDMIDDKLYANDLTIKSEEHQNGETIITASSTLFNNTSDVKEARIILAIYEDGKLINIVSNKSDPVESGQSVNVSSNYTATSGAGRYIFKTFVWDNIVSIKPISNTVVHQTCPKNIIYMIGDGMGPNEIIYGQYYFVGADGKLTMQTLPALGSVSTYPLNGSITDSAAAATALATGYKTNTGHLGQSADNVPIKYKNLMEAAKEKGLCVGVVTNDKIVGATPSGFTVHTSSRDNYQDIANQMATSCDVDVLMGGSQQTVFDNLISTIQGRGFTYVTTGDSMLTAQNNNKLFGVFSSRPVLKDMAKKAIDILDERDTNDKGFILMVEETEVDAGGHASNIVMSRNAVKRFDDAVKVALDYAKQDGNTLVIVTADHETGGLVIDSLPSAPGQEGTIRWTSSGNHTGVNVNLFAYGPGSMEFDGSYDNTDIPKKLSRLLGWESIFPAVLSN